NFGGIMLWALDLDDDISTLLQSTKIDFCQNLNKTVTYDCTSVDVGTRWWTIDNGGLERNRMCGKYAPLIDGYYAVCDPGDPSFSCCGPFGKCGTGDDFCKCSVCVDYGAQPSRVFEEPVKPTRPVQ
ncbi:Protein T13H5.3, partial [Aphelenchoides avenae]